MGNCLQSWRSGRDDEEEEKVRQQIQAEIEEEKSKGVDHEFGNSGMKVKIVLTREELELLLLQLQNINGGGKSVQDVLEDLQRGRLSDHHQKTQPWKPSLESIMESPECLEMDRSSPS